ncbi:MAG TPA: hypothetical protein PL193_09920 [Xanthobacteraceae bacterium]|nr:hypothetical protein [Xanthobacteraceae bacterium]
MKVGNVIMFASALLASSASLAQDKPQIETNQNYIEGLNRNAQAPVADKKEMLQFVLRALPDRVKVYPTENYYYFGFYSGGIRYAGNIRLDASDRDKGKLHFAYFVDNVAWLPEPPVNYAVMDIADGVKVEKVERFLYRVTAGDRSVLFELNDLSNARPPEHMLDPDERFIGPVFDESGMRFFLVFNAKLGLFHYILDETIPLSDRLTRIKATDRIEIGTRTGFAFYRDLKRERRILIGAFEDNVLGNNYFDGPFDQLPDNFIEGDDLLKAILQVAPHLQGTIDRFGGSFDGSERFLIAPYMTYRLDADLMRAHHCATGPQGKGPRYYACFQLDQAPEPPPAKLKNPPRGKAPPR